MEKSGHAMIGLKLGKIGRLLGRRTIQVCYALASDGDQRYIDLVAISALAVKRFHPSAKIVVLTDDQSFPLVQSLLGQTGLGDVVRTVGAYQDKSGARGRFVKTQVRQFIDGDFLY